MAKHSREARCDDPGPFRAGTEACARAGQGEPFPGCTAGRGAGRRSAPTPTLRGTLGGSPRFFVDDPGGYPEPAPSASVIVPLPTMPPLTSGKPPARPVGKPSRAPVRAWAGSTLLPTYLPALPDRNPMFLEKRVYQGSSGRVYPLPFTDRIRERVVNRNWKVVWLENRYLRVMILPELGGRIHALLDKTTGYDLIYSQPVIKPALVGLAGPWISGGIEFNWPQHHRPATFLPVDCEIEEHPDRSRTVWCSDHDPMCRMKGMHGVCLHPDRAYVELKVRAYNRTQLTQTFLWWANVATRVHEGYQSFFPPDVTHVADHAKRAVSDYPLCKARYYGVDYGKRGRKGVPKDEVPGQFVPPHAVEATRKAPSGADSGIRGRKSGLPGYAANDLSFYANIPVPTSYMCMGSQQDFFGGYDHFAQAGIVHIADHHIAPGKKQWTWGNHEFGYAWDRNLTEPDARGEYAPYIELMAGVFTDNQPDFSFLRPGETRVWSQFWYPIHKIGPARHANLDAAVSLAIDANGIRIGVSVTRTFRGAVVRLERRNGGAALEWDADLAPGKPFVVECQQSPKPWASTECRLRVLTRGGREILCYGPKPAAHTAVPTAATEPPLPAAITSNDELYITGLHLEQYRHATRCPTPYWREALRRDPLDARCNNAMGLWHLRRGEFDPAEAHFRRAIERHTRRNPNPADSEPHYNLGLCLRHLGRDAEAYDAFHKATWDQAWTAAGFHALAELDCVQGRWINALEHLDRSLRRDTDNTRARNLKALVLRKLKRSAEARVLIRETLVLDPLDWWARQLNGEPFTCDLQIRLDIAHDLARAGFLAEAVRCLQGARIQKRDLPDQSWGALPMVHYTLGWLQEKLGRTASALASRKRASAAPPDYCFPSRLEDIAVLESALCADSRDARAACYLGNLLYDKRRHEEAIRMWERSSRLHPDYSVVWRNLGMGCFNIRHQPARARTAYNRAFKADPTDARLLYERDQLWKRTGESPKRRLRELEKHLSLVQRRDDLSVELCALYNQMGQPARALRLLGSRRFQPWEGGEGGPLGQHVRSNLALGRQALREGNPAAAQRHFESALSAPRHLGEAKHLLANQSDIHYWLGCALWETGDHGRARRHWRTAASFKGDFQEMSVRAFSEMTYYSALSWQRLGQSARAEQLLRALLSHAQQLQRMEAKIDYFATSLPAMLLFEDDLQARQTITALFLKAQARLGLGQRAAGRRLLKRVLQRDPNHALAADLLNDA